jgi:hypothetical protein
MPSIHNKLITLAKKVRHVETEEEEVTKVEHLLMS